MTIPPKYRLTKKIIRLNDEADIPELRDDNRNRIEGHLLPRRSEILNIIRDHRQVSFDFLHRRFSAISDRLLRYDLKKLGVTRGAVYVYKKLIT